MRRLLAIICLAFLLGGCKALVPDSLSPEKGDGDGAGAVSSGENAK